MAQPVVELDPCPYEKIGERKRGSVGRSFRVGPAVVGAGDAVVDLLPGVLADVVDEHPAGAGLEGEGERVAQAERPDRAVRACCGVEERIDGGDRAVGVDAEDLAETVVECLRVRPVRVLADGDEELAVGAEVERAAVVVRGAREVLELEDHDLAAGSGHVAHRGEPADAVVNRGRRGRVVDVHEVVDGEVRVERNAEQAALTR